MGIEMESREKNRIQTAIVSGLHICPSGGVLMLDPPRALDAKTLRDLEEMAVHFLRKYGKKKHASVGDKT